jgi:CRP/FNR family transcriptional regulator, anaerobic regulatory protein
MWVDCRDCPLRMTSAFRPLEGAELDFVRSVKTAQRTFAAKTEIITAGDVLDSVFTLFSGWAVRYAMLDGRDRQILDILLPGDLIGLQGAMTGEIGHSVRAVTSVSLCTLDWERFRSIFDDQPELSEALTSTLLQEERRADARLLLIGQQRPLARLCYLFLELRERLLRRGLIADGSFDLPLTYEQIGDTVGMSRSQVGASLAEKDRKWARLSAGVLTIENRSAMEDWCRYQPIGDPSIRALI